MWIRFMGMTEFGCNEIIIQSHQLGYVNKVSIDDQTFYHFSWRSGHFTYYTVVDTDTAKRLVDAGAKICRQITDYPLPTPEHRCIYRALNTVKNRPDVTKIPFNALSVVEHNKFLMNEVEHVSKYLNRYGVVTYEVIGSKLVNGEEREVSSIVSSDVFDTLKAIGVPTQEDIALENKLVFRGILNTTGQIGTVVIDQKHLSRLDRVNVHNYDPVFRISWTHNTTHNFPIEEFAVVDKAVAMQIVGLCRPKLRQVTEYPFQTHGDRCVLQALPAIPIEQAKHRWDVVEDDNGRKMFYGDIQFISRYLLDNGVVTTGIALVRTFQGARAGSRYGLSYGSFIRFKDAGVRFEDRLQIQLKDLEIANLTSESTQRAFRPLM